MSRSGVADLIFREAAYTDLIFREVAYTDLIFREVAYTDLIFREMASTDLIFREVACHNYGWPPDLSAPRRHFLHTPFGTRARACAHVRTRA